MQRKTHAIVFTEANKVALQSYDLPPCGPKEVIAETIFSFVSPGTELRVLSGGHESEVKFPLIPGYSWVGRVIEVGSELKAWKVGELVSGKNPIPVPGINSLWGGQASCHRVVVSGYDSVLKLPENADPWDYVAMEVAAISWRGASAATQIQWAVDAATTEPPLPERFGGQATDAGHRMKQTLNIECKSLENKKWKFFQKGNF
ncbi:MAG: alcohol dehydrogenase catalytic domain-containing protein [Kiritimatiellae bacterium]|nr:alcohol dehydrogenase catalytic domain-containing protein [Kiritimatiellia bacterium]